MHTFRSVLAVLAGLLLISVVVESLEFTFVALVNGGVTTDPDIYMNIRNGPGFLTAKLGYNTAAALAGGWVCAWLARRAPLAHGVILAVVQTFAFAWAVANPAIRRSTPDWMWACLIVLTSAAIVAGAFLRHRSIAFVDRSLHSTAQTT